MNLSGLNNDQVHAVAVHLASAEAIIHTRLAVDMRSEGRRYRIRVGRDATPVQVSPGEAVIGNSMPNNLW